MNDKAHKLSDKEVWDVASVLIKRFGEDAVDLSSLALQYLRIFGEDDLLEASTRIHDAVRALLDLGMSGTVSVH